MKKQINPTIKAHLIRGAFYLLLLLAVCAIPFVLAEQAKPFVSKKTAAANAAHFPVAARLAGQPVSKLSTLSGKRLIVNRPDGSSTLWYNGDFNGVNGLANEENTSIGSGQFASVYDNFIVPSPGWNVTAVFSDDLENTNVTGATWEIRQGVAEGTGGTLIASGMTTTPMVTPTGRSGFGFTEFMVEVTGLNVNLPPGTYWLNVTVVGDLSGRSFDSTTSGANCVGTPCGNDQNAFFNSNFFGANWQSTAEQGQPSDFSMGVIGTVGGGGTPSPTPTASPTPTCPSGYTTTTSTGTITPGGTDIGNHCDDCFTQIDLPFPVSVYGVPTSTAWPASNGDLHFANPTLKSFYYMQCVPVDPSPDGPWPNTFFPFYDDMLTMDGPFQTCSDCGIFTQTVGSPPNRQFIIRWKTVYFNNAGNAEFEVILTEGSDTLSVIYGDTGGDNGLTAASGIQQDLTVFTSFSCFEATLTSGLRVDYTPLGCGSPSPTPTATATATPTATAVPRSTPTPRPRPTPVPRP